MTCALPVGEWVVPHFTCECGFHLDCTHWPEKDNACGEVYDYHMRTPGHLMSPDDAPPGVEIECLTPDCEHNGCNASDCVAGAQTHGECGYCGEARVVVLPLQHKEAA